MSFRIKVTSKHVDPSRANYQQDEFSGPGILSSMIKSDGDINVRPTSNTTFTSASNPSVKGHSIRQTDNCSEDYM